MTTKPRRDEDDDIQEYKKPWVGLTDEEHTSIQKQADYNQFMSASEFAARCQVLVEAKLKEKNT